MTTSLYAPSNARILIATDSVADAEVVKGLLHREFSLVFVSTDAALAVGDFDQVTPDVLVLAFGELEKSERYYLGLYRQSQIVHSHPHRTIILCSKEDIQRAYELCVNDYFDDYILFWPMTYDSSRLLMSIHSALRELSSLKSGAPSAAELAAQVQLMAEAGNELAQRMTQGDHHVETASKGMVQAEKGIDTALDGLSRRLPPAAGTHDEISRFKSEEVRQHFRHAAESAEPLKQWTGELKMEGLKHMETVRALSEMAQSVRPIVLVVDDDEMQRKIIAHLLGEDKYHLILAASGIQALGVLRKTQPDVILMDIMMPDMDGMEATRRLKQIPQFSRTPVIMITGDSEEKVVRDCLKAGATDFMVKPFEKHVLIEKITHALNSRPLPSR